jgi:hypothetical protein
VHPVPDPLLRKSGIAGNRTLTSGSVARNSDHWATEAVTFMMSISRVISDSELEEIRKEVALSDLRYTSAFTWRNEERSRKTSMIMGSIVARIRINTS